MRALSLGILMQAPMLVGVVAWGEGCASKLKYAYAAWIQTPHRWDRPMIYHVSGSLKRRTDRRTMSMQKSRLLGLAGRILVMMGLAPLLSIAVNAEQKTNIQVALQLGHLDSVTSVAFSPDGRWVLSGGGRDKTLKLWDVATGRELRTFSGHGDMVWSVAFSPDGQSVLSGSSDKTLKLWDAVSGRELRTFSGHGADVLSGGTAILSVAFSSDGRTALSGGEDRTLKLWDVASGRELRTFAGHRNAVRLVAFSPDGRSAVSGSEDRTLKLWDVASGRELRTFTGHVPVVDGGAGVYSVAFSRDGRSVLSGSGDGIYRLECQVDLA